MSCVPTDAAACHTLAEALRRGIGVPQDAARAAELSERGCTAGHPISCTALGLMVQDGFGVKRDAARALSLYGRACDLGAGVGCFNAGLMYEAGADVPLDLQKARDEFKRARGIFTKACKEGDLEVCTNLGILDERAYDDGSHPDRAAATYEDGCKRGEQTCCVNLALLLDEGRGVARDEKRSLELLETTCKQGLSFACAALGQSLLDDPAATPADIQRSVALTQDACDRGTMEACNSLGGMYVVGPPPPQTASKSVIVPDLKKALPLLDRACSGDQGEACERLADTLLNAGPIGADKARSYFEKACDMGMGGSCGSLANMPEAAGATHDPNREKALFTRGCALKDSTSCMELVRRKLELPDGLPKGLYDLACSKGDKHACASASAK